MELLADPYARLRRETPIAWVPSLGRYLVTDYQNCHAIEQDQATFTAAVTGAGATMVRALGGHPCCARTTLTMLPSEPH